MEAVLIALLPKIIGCAVVPVQIVVNLLLLKSPQQGLLKAIGFLAGMTITRLMQGLVFGLIFSESIASSGSGNGKSLIISTLLLVLGILLLTAGYKTWKGEDDSEDSPPKIFSMIDSLTPAKAFGIGLGIPLIAAKQWVFTLSALATIAAAQLGLRSGAITYLIFVLLVESLVILPILFRILLPNRSKSSLASLSAWLTRNNRPITITVSIVFGLYFLQAGIRGLLV